MRYSIYNEDDKPEADSAVLRLDEGQFAGTVFTFSSIKLVEPDSSNADASLAFDCVFFKIKYEGQDIKLDEGEQMPLAQIVGDDLAHSLLYDIGQLLNEILENPNNYEFK